MLNDNCLSLILSTNHFDELVLNSKLKCKSKNINCFLLSDKVKNIIKEGNLYYEENDAGLLIFHDKQAVFQLYLFLNINIPFNINRKNKPIISEFPGYISLNEKSKKCIQHLEANGFLYNTTVRQLIIDYDIEKTNFDFLTKEKYDYEITFAKPEHLDAIYKIWVDSFDPIVNPLPSKVELATQIDLKETFCAISKTNEVVGTLQAELTDNEARYSRGAVLPEHRRKKLLQSMTYFSIKNAFQKNITKHILWVEEKNEASNACHLKMGYEFNKKFSEQYLLK